MIDAEDRSGRVIPAITYTAQGKEVDGKPSLRYIKLLREGARAHGLPETYIRFYTDVVGCRHLSTTPNGQMVFLDAAGTCLILVKRDAPINPVRDDHGGVHHAFAVGHDEYKAALDHLRAHGVEITFEEDRQGGVLNGPRAYFHDPDGTVLEFIDLTSYAGSPS